MQTEMKPIFILTMSEDERRWLQGSLQNYLGEGEEDISDRDIREKFFRSLSHSATTIKGDSKFTLTASQDNEYPTQL